MKKIHITLLGGEVLPAYYTIPKFQPDITYIIGTSGTINEMARFTKVLEEEGWNFEERRTEPYDVLATIKVCEQIHLENGEECEYIYNVTGGTKPMAIGALLCAQQYNAEIGYTNSEVYLNLQNNEKTELKLKLEFENLFALQGQKVKKRFEYKPNPFRTQCAQASKNFRSNDYRIFDTLRTEYENYSQYVRYHRLPHDFKPEIPGISYIKDGDTLTIEQDGNKLFSSPYRNAEKLLFEGRWWEVLVADAVYKWAKGKYEIWTSVEFDQTTNKKAQNWKLKNNVKNEIDVLVNLGNKLLVLECKSGKFEQANIDKLSAICKTYGSYKSKGAIVAFNKDNVKEHLRQRAIEQKVEIVVPREDFSNFESEMNRVINSSKS